ncbi:MAG: DNA cytosine methyltransferase [Rhizobiaceae bacterium]|nr:DNA cytosine methyltransferase [Rhizobiaceae bacterium]
MNGLFPFESQADFPPMIVDSFAGGGGASTGIEMALGRSPDIAINHNPAALALHAANHPDTLHLSENVWQVDPLDYVKGRHVGLAWFSPDCKHFSKAKGGKPVERNIRDLAWVVVLWAERVRPDVILLENVEEFSDWGPLREEERGGKVVLMPDPDKRGATFAKWAKQLRKLGYRLEHRELRACDYGAPTIRKRLFLVARCDGQKIVWPKPTHAPLRVNSDGIVTAWAKGHGLTLKDLQGLKPYRTAAEIIDWSLPCPSIFDTSDEVFARHGLRAVRPLASATMSRVARGVKRYVLDAKRPFLVNLTHGEVSPSGVKRWGKGHRSIDDPLSVVTAGGINHAVIAPSLIQTGYGEREGQAPRALDIEKPLGTVVAGGVKHAVVVPSLVGCGGRAGQSRPRGGDEPVATMTAKADVCVTAAFLAQHNNDSRRVGGVNPGRPAEEPISTITQAPQQALVSAFMLRQFGQSVGHGMDEPAHTATADVNKSAVIVPHLITMRNAAKPFNGADEPTHTVTAGGAGLCVVAPFFQTYYGTGDGQRADEPSRTITVKDRLGLCEGELQPPPLTGAQLDRAREVAAFLRGHGFWDEREFVTVDLDGEFWTIVDIGMRMLTPRELFSAQGFPPDYVIDVEHDGRPLSKSDQIACCGNSICPPLAAALVAANCGHLAAYREVAE